jgi:hypothetical protein
MLRGTLSDAWQHVPILQPAIDPGLAELNGVERIAEALRYKILQLEYTLSRGGGLRAWLRLNLLLGLLLCVPALLLVPVVTLLLNSFTTWSALLLLIALNVLYAVLVIAALVAAVIALHFGVRRYLVSMRKNRIRTSRWRQ